MEYILASIFDAFELVLGAKLGGKMDQKWIQKGIGKMYWFFIGFGCVFESVGWGEEIDPARPAKTQDSLLPPQKDIFFKESN